MLGMLGMLGMLRMLGPLGMLGPGPLASAGHASTTLPPQEKPPAERRIFRPNGRNAGPAHKISVVSDHADAEGEERNVGRNARHSDVSSVMTEFPRESGELSVTATMRRRPQPGASRNRGSSRNPGVSRNPAAAATRREPHPAAPAYQRPWIAARKYFS
jgi:hypothetical protein